MKEPRSRAAAPAKATREVKPTRPTKTVRAKTAASAAKTATVTQLPNPAKAAPGPTIRSKGAGAADYRKEIDGLRREVEELKARIARIRSETDVPGRPPAAVEDAHPWLKIAATVGVTFVLGKLMQALRIPAAAAVAVPMITAEVNRRIL